MFVSFFPAPRFFFWSVVLWVAICVAGLVLGANSLGDGSGSAGGRRTAPGRSGSRCSGRGRSSGSTSTSPSAVGLFAAFWKSFAPHPWWRWSILGSALILFTTYFQVQVTVAINDWYGPFYDLIQAALGKTRDGDARRVLRRASPTFLGIALVAVAVGVLSRFFVSHYVFRWRTAMNDYYMSHWPRLRHIEGASQRVQEDTMRFSTTTESLGRQPARRRS